MPAFSWLALFFGAFYFVYGAYLPFWSLWLEGIGVSAEQIGLLLGVGMAIRFAGNLMVMGRVKGAGQLLPVTRLLCLLSYEGDGDPLRLCPNASIPSDVVSRCTEPGP